jgi:anti-sigma regulatory factor (Ser/Thr protein kinase)
MGMKTVNANLAPRTSAHAVTFYEQDRDLVRIVCSHVADGVARGEKAVVIATSEHTEMFFEELVRRDVPLGGSIVSLDARETLAKFMVDGAPDPIAFDRVIGELVRAIAGDDLRVCAYGEMVAVLWEEGNVTGALRVEELWNDLLAEVEFSLLCAYPTSIIADDQVLSVRHVCHLHTEVLGDPLPLRERGEAADRERAFPKSNESVRAARQFVTETIQRWGYTELIDDASVVVTELVTNAILHARSPFSVVVGSRDGRLRIAVRDANQTPPARRTPVDLQAGGRGLGVIDALADRSGCELTPDGKMIWAEFTI